MTIKKKYTIDEFQAFLENTNSLKNHELLNGEIIEVTSNIYSSVLATALKNFIRGKSLGYNQRSNTFRH
ncbi:MAG: hypothetical protein ACPG7F_14635 [Aggregatilineales bacterium]